MDQTLDTMKIKTKINSKFANFAPDYKNGHCTLLDRAAADDSGQSTILLVYNRKKYYEMQY